MVAKGITSASQLKGKTLATPSLGNTQDVALRYWLKQNGVATTTTGGGDAFIKPTTPNSAAVLEFKSAHIHPRLGTRAVRRRDGEGRRHGPVQRARRDHLARGIAELPSAHPAVVADLIKAQVQAYDFIKSSPAAAQADANAELASYTGKALSPSIVAAAFKEITFTNDPDASSLTSDAAQAVSLGLLKPVNLTGIFDLTPLNQALSAARRIPA